MVSIMGNLLRKLINWRNIILIFMIAVYIFFLSWRISGIGIDSDRANHLLQADDILSGNFFMKDWNLTGITFFTTDLVYYEIARLLSGVSEKAVWLSGGLMVTSIVLVSLCASMKGCKQYKEIKTLLFCLVAGIPCFNYLVSSRVHGGAVFLSILSFCTIYEVMQMSGVNRKQIVDKYIVLLILVLLGVFGDFLFVIEMVLPVILFCFYKLLMIQDNYEGRKYKVLLTVVSAGVCGAFILEKIFFFVGGANKNSYISGQLFTSSLEWSDKIDNFISCILDMNYANFTGGEIADIWNSLKIMNMAISLFASVCIFHVLLKFLKEKGTEQDILSVLLAISVILSVAAYLFTDMAQARYVTIVPMAGMIIIVRNYDDLIANVTNRRLGNWLLIIIAIVSFTGKVHEISTFDYSQNHSEDRELIAFLNEHDLNYGYASFWNASKMTVLSNKRVNIRHIKENNGMFDMYNWFNKNEWYHENTNFVLIDNKDETRGESDVFGVSETKIMNAFGVPIESYSVNHYLVLVYDYNLSSELLFK